MPDQKHNAEPYVPEHAGLAKLAEAAQKCHGCPLYKHATQVVFGEGSSHAKIMLVGEQPGDVEDKTGHPFTGPAGKILDKAMAAAGLAREICYFTNAVKHFKFEERGKRRLHKKPRVIEVHACYPWLEAEIELVKPEVIVCLGATATRAILGPTVKVMQDHGQDLPSPLAPHVVATIHPSSVLRMTDHETRVRQMKLLVTDLEKAAGF